jgi:hypothetical protein
VEISHAHRRFVGTLLIHFVAVGTQRRAKKATHHTAAAADAGEDKKIKSAIKKFGKQLQDRTYWFCL